MNLKTHNQIINKTTIDILDTKANKKNNPHSNKNILHKTTKTIIHPKYKKHQQQYN